MGVLAPHQEDFDLGTANFDLQVTGVAGLVVGVAPGLTALMGGGAFRMFYEFHAVGVAQGAFQTTPDVPSVALSPLPTETRITVVPAIALGDILPVDDNGSPDYRFLISDFDDQRLPVVVIDGSWTSASPAAPVPALRVWLEAMGGTVAVDIQ